MTAPRLVLLTGATGYVGGRLLAVLEARGRPLRCMVRRPQHLRARVAPGTEVVAGDVLDPASLTAALAGVDVAYYMVHSMHSTESFEDADRAGARNFARAALAAGVRRVACRLHLRVRRPPADAAPLDSETIISHIPWCHSSNT